MSWDGPLWCHRNLDFPQPPRTCPEFMLVNRKVEGGGGVADSPLPGAMSSALGSSAAGLSPSEMPVLSPSMWVWVKINLRGDRRL